MSSLLYLQASPRVRRSHSRAVADAFVASYRDSHPEDEVVTIDLFEKELPAFDGMAVQAKYTILNGKQHSNEEAEAWQTVEAIIEEFKRADKYVIACPMWNFSIPYRLKQYIDVIVQPGYTFSFSPETGYTGLVTGKPALIVSARGGEYGSDDTKPLNFQKTYLELILGFIGFTDIQSIVIEPTLMGGPETATAKRDQAVEQAKTLAKTF